MGLGGISLWQLLIVLLIVILIFGTKRLSNIGSDLGGAVKGFRKGIEDEPEDKEPEKIAKAENTAAEASPEGEKETVSGSSTKDV